jgi:hypothetical protein
MERLPNSDDFPPNSHASKRRAREEEEREIKRVTSEDPIRRKKSIGKQFKETFVSGDIKTSVRYAFFEVFIPAAKDMVVESFEQGVRNLILGDTRRRRGSSPPQSGPYGYVDYTSRRSGAPYQSSAARVMTRRGREVHDFDEIILASRIEAEEVIDQMFEMLSRYDTVSVANLYSLLGLPSTHVDTKWGWSDLRGSGVSKTRGGYLLDLPEPQSFT